MFGDFLADIDVDATRAFYQRHVLENDCQCTGCVNFRKYADVCDPRIREAFEAFGVPMKCVLEIIPEYEEKRVAKQNGGNLYHGFFPVVGNIIGDFRQEDIIASQRKITDSFRFFLDDAVHLNFENFPRPVLQIDFSAYVPWLLECENDYVC